MKSLLEEMGTIGTYGVQSQQGTGSLSIPYRTVVCPFGQYEITVVLTGSNEFVGISEVKLNRDFLSYKQKVTPQGYHDVSAFYRE